MLFFSSSPHPGAPLKSSHVAGKEKAGWGWKATLPRESQQRTLKWVERCVLKARRVGSPCSRQLLAAHEINTNGWLGSGWEATSPRSGFRQNREARDDRPASRREVTAGALCAFGCLAQVCATPGRKRERWAAPGGRKSWHFLSVRLWARGFLLTSSVSSRISVSLSRVRLFATPWTVAHQAPLSMEFSRQEYWSVLTQGSNLGLLHCRQILYRLSHLGSPSTSVDSGINLWGQSCIGQQGARPNTPFKEILVAPLGYQCQQPTAVSTGQRGSRDPPPQGQVQGPTTVRSRGLYDSGKPALLQSCLWS